MNSPNEIKREKITCVQCEQYKKELQEKDTKIKILENNILKIKSLLTESGSLIDGYNEIMEENKNLKIEIENLKNDINLNNNNNYQFELLKQKMLRYQQENQELKATKQFYESQKAENMNIKEANEIKIKRELSLKDKEINQLNTVICLLKLHNNEQMLSNEEIIKKYSKLKNNNNNKDNSIIDEDEILFMENDNNKINTYNIYNNEIGNNNNYMNNNNNFMNNNNIKMIDLYKEKEFLSDEYQKYKQKYIVYKFKYHEFKKTTKLFLNYMKVIPPGASISNIFDSSNEKKSLNLLGTKRYKSFNDREEIKNNDNLNIIRNISINSGLRKKSEETFKDIFKMPSLYNNSFNDNEDEENNGEDGNDADIKIVESEKEKNKKNKKEKDTKKKSSKRKSNKKNIIKIKEETDSNKSNNDGGDDDDIFKSEEKTEKKEKKKRGRKPKKLKKTEIDEDDKEEKEKEKENKHNNKEKDKDKKEGKKKDNKKEEKNKEKDKEQVEDKENKEEDKCDEKNENKEEEKKEDDNKVNSKEKEKEKENKLVEEHIGPIPKNIKKKLDPIEQKALNTNNLLNLLSNNPDKITEETLTSILGLQNTIQEKTSFLFEIIIPNLIKIELSRVLSLFEVFIEMHQDSKSMIGINILENINLNLNSNNLLNKKIHLKISNRSNETYKNYINKNFSQAIFLISFLIDILYRKLTDISCVSNFIYQLLFEKNIDNKSKHNILLILIKTIKEKNINNNNSDNIKNNNDKGDGNKAIEDVVNNNININNKIYFKNELLNKYLSKENENKFYFFLTYKNNLVSEKIINLILIIYDKPNKIKNENNKEKNNETNINEDIKNNTNEDNVDKANNNNISKDTEIINHLNNLFNNIPNDKELKIEVPNFLEEYKSSIKFNTDIFYLEIFQALNIIVEIKDMKWIYENVFTNLLWKNFQNSKKDSLKRALSIFYSSILFYLCLKNGIKNHGNDNLLEQQEFSRLYGWLYSIYNTQPQFENLIGYYEKLCALSWIVESPIMTMSTKVEETIKEVVNNIVKGEKESLCPTDFLDKLRKLKLL